ncbi:DNA polymerase III subunit chi [Denitrificimonas sp. JX-1]|uniref:DNA polymerase III subunit chi n=1 Tax=Denitrificimonas halotolerans TaxID=3098930 RepID=A0ABU5GPQ1_9GAMM|nr:DNA polymerase III subunit chi [Denitrificimonas sp. JX-1]MDY7218979.1 DNA polymerase III subunit chi [Denitrificimonas sp. JX-1]
MRVEFYVLPTTQTADRLNAACRLAHKAWHAGFTTFIRCADTKQQAQLDEMLWTFRRPSFIPHALYSDHCHAPVILAIDERPQHTPCVLINLHPKISSHLDCFNRVIEIVNQDPEQLNISRHNFVNYRKQGYKPARVEL